jgi:hypothetical protein
LGVTLLQNDFIWPSFIEELAYVDILLKMDPAAEFSRNDSQKFIRQSGSEGLGLTCPGIGILEWRTKGLSLGLGIGLRISRKVK